MSSNRNETGHECGIFQPIAALAFTVPSTSIEFTCTKQVSFLQFMSSPSHPVERNAFHYVAVFRNLMETCQIVADFL